MNVILKYPLNEFTSFLNISTKSKFCHFGMQLGRPTVWFEVPEEDDGGSRGINLAVFGTGHLIPSSYKFLATTFDGDFVWHLYEVTI